MRNSDIKVVYLLFACFVLFLQKLDGFKKKKLFFYKKRLIVDYDRRAKKHWF